jgi:branched-chain amino acid transport system permease protein
MASFDFQVLVNGIIAAGSYALLAFSFQPLYKLGKFFDLTPAAGCITGAYVTLLIATTLHWSIARALFIGVVAATLLGVIAHLAVLRPLQRKRSGSSEKFLATLGLIVVVQSVIAITFGDDTKVLIRHHSNAIERYGLTVTQPQLAILLAAAVLLVVAIFAEGSYAGRVYRAVAGDEELARIVGVRVNLVRMVTSGCSLAIAGLAGALIGADIGLTPGMGFRAILMGVVAAVIGGIGSFRGVMLGALLIGITQNLVAWWISTAWQDAATFLLLIIFLVARPQGILGKPLRRASV